MKLESIHQETIAGTDQVITTAIVSQVISPCLLTRRLIDILGRPTVDNDLEMLGVNDTCTIVWSWPQLTLQEATLVLNQAVATEKNHAMQSA
ncbi:MAG: hypothetical protein AAGE59_23195 [Cyanobacteria bacterium P01_F01_bin.86]